MTTLHRLFILEYDGVLTAGAAGRHRTPTPEVLCALQDLRRAGDSVWVVSDRSVEQVAPHLPAGVGVVGETGAQWRGACPHPDRDALASLVRRHAATGGCAVHMEGLAVRVTPTAHGPASWSALTRALSRLPLPRGWCLVRAAHQLEFHPLGLDGVAVVRQLLRQHRGAFPVLLGRATCDDAAFRAVEAAGGVGVRVGAPREGPGGVGFRLSGTADVARCLTLWSDPPLHPSVECGA